MKNIVTSKHTPKDNIQIERAIKFLVERINQCGNNPKPVILHSIRVAFRLDTLDYNRDVIIAALLHDVVEDSETTIEEVKKYFGKKVGRLVASCTFDKKMKDKTEMYKKNFEKVAKTSEEALFIRAADLLDNSNYYYLVKEKQARQELLNKLDFFLSTSKKMIANKKIYKTLLKKRKELVKL